MTVFDARSAWDTSFTKSQAYSEVEKIHASLVTLTKHAKSLGYSNTNVSDMYANVLIEKGYTGNVNATSVAFNTIFTSVLTTS